MIPRKAMLATLLAAALLLAAWDRQTQPLLLGVSSNALADATLVRGNSQVGFLYETMFPSSALGLGPPFRIYLPPGYDRSTQRYPVLYLLHGNAYDIDYKEWSDNMQVDSTAGAMINAGQISPLIIAMPYGDHSYFVNVQGGPQWATYIAQDVVAYVDANFRSIPDRQHRAIGGNSMGGSGALQLAFNHPDVFSTVGGHSAALQVDSQPGTVFADWDYYRGFDPLRLAESAPNLGTLQIWLDVGDQDPWRGNMGGLHDRLTARGIAHTWNMFPGPHDTQYWVSHAPDYLKFYTTGMQQSIPWPPPAPTAAPAPQPTVAPTPLPAPPPAVPGSPSFNLGFSTLASLIPGVVGQPLENEHYGPNGDSLQQTTAGLMVWRKADNWTAFTNGSRTWVNGPSGVMERGNDQRFDWEK